MDVAILDDDDVAVPAGAPGHICLRATEPWVAAQGYYKLPEATLASRRNLWFHTGDVGRLDADGYLHFEGRSSDAIRRRGENVSAFEVEQILLGHPDVADIAAFGVKAETSEDEVMVSVVPRDGHLVNPEDLVRFAAANMSYFMVPRYVDVVNDLPRTATAKVEKGVLRADAEARLGQVWDRESQGIIIRRT
jgi:crotonobetaine/carnitine-CoA ligase